MCDFSNQSPISELKPDCKTARPHDRKTDLTDFTFLMPLRIDSEKRRENADTSISFILRHFDTTVIVVEDLRYFREIFKGKEEVSIKADAVN
jgi:hypothetical protein